MLQIMKTVDSFVTELTALQKNYKLIKLKFTDQKINLKYPGQITLRSQPNVRPNNDSDPIWIELMNFNN